MVYTTSSGEPDVNDVVKRIYAGYDKDPRQEVAKGLKHMAQVMQRNDPMEVQGMKIGLLIGALVSNVTTTFDGQRFLRSIVDDHFRLREEAIQAYLKDVESKKQALEKPQNKNAPMDAVNDFLNKYKSSNTPTGGN